MKKKISFTKETRKGRKYVGVNVGNKHFETPTNPKLGELKGIMKDNLSVLKRKHMKKKTNCEPGEMYNKMKAKQAKKKLIIQKEKPRGDSLPVKVYKGVNKILGRKRKTKKKLSGIASGVYRGVNKVFGYKPKAPTIKGIMKSASPNSFIGRNRQMKEMIDSI